MKKTAAEGRNLSTHVSVNSGPPGKQKFSSTKSNHWDFHLIDIVFKINYVVYVHLTEDEDGEKGNFSLFRFFPRRILF
jgi:hypothetical protein